MVEIKSNKFSKYFGVQWHKKNNKWQAQLHNKYIGCFNTELEAALCIDKYLRLEGSKRVNFPNNENEYGFLPYIKNNLVYIPLINGELAFCDVEYFDLVSNYTWHIHKRNEKIECVSTLMIIDGYKHQVKLHKLLLPQYKMIDHINNNSLDNRKCNLREATKSQNEANSFKKRKNTSSKYKGVYWNKNNQKWASKIIFNYKNIFLGYFKDEVEAAKAYNKKAIELFGEFSLLNTI